MTLVTLKAYVGSLRDVENVGLFDSEAIEANRLSLARPSLCWCPGLPKSVWPCFITERDETLRELQAQSRQVHSEQRGPRPQGNFYQASLSFDAEAVFALDKPWEEQSEKVRAAIGAVGYIFEPGTAGQNIYEALCQRGSGEPGRLCTSSWAAHDFLRTNGIVAVQYFCGADSTRYERARNGGVSAPRNPDDRREFWKLFEKELVSGYIVLDGGMVTLTHKNGQPLPAPSPEQVAAEARAYQLPPDEPEQTLGL